MNWISDQKPTFGPVLFSTVVLVTGAIFQPAVCQPLGAATLQRSSFQEDTDTQEAEEKKSSRRNQNEQNQAGSSDSNRLSSQPNSSTSQDEANGIVPRRNQVPEPLEPAIAEASNEGQLALQNIKLPESVKATLFAAEPLVANPVAIDVDVNGRVLVCESFRQERGVEDNRNHPEWLLEDLAARTVTERLNYMKKHLGDKILSYSEQDDRIRILEDTDNDGVADTSQIIASGFNRPEDGTGAGVLRVGNQLFYTCIPHLWLLEAEEDGEWNRQPLHSGFGVRFAFRGHDLHGLTMGLDGRLYFSIGDRGYNLGNEIADVESGAVFRCELDGSNLEVFATGLRNPQELAFDDHGNLFTGDNNSDSGIDQARFVYLVEGGDSGWRMQYQYLDDRGPFVRDEIWNPKSEKAPAYIVPAIDIVGDGPSGLTYYPGTGWGSDYRGHFFLCDFRGQANLSGIRTIELSPKGGSFEIIKNKQEIWNVLATDVDFGPDGRLYVSDWVESWDGVGKGRIYAFDYQDEQDDQYVELIQIMLKEGMSDRTESKLGDLLGHADRRIRLEAQFELVRRKAFDDLVRLSLIDNELAQLHALWGLSQLARTGFSASPKQKNDFQNVIKELHNSATPFLRSNACKAIGENGFNDLNDRLIAGLQDADPHVRYHAMMSLGKTGTHLEVDAVHDFLISDVVQKDRILRHAGIMALTGITRRYNAGLTSPVDREKVRAEHPLLRSASHPHYQVRLASVVAMRKLRSNLVLGMLEDPHPLVAEEMARLLYSFPTKQNYTALANQLNNRKPNQTIPFLRRMIHANYLLGEAEHCARLMYFVRNAENDYSLRLELMQLLSNWSEPEPVDKINGRVRFLKKRDNIGFRLSLARIWETIQTETPEMQLAFVEAIRNAKAKSGREILKNIIMSNRFDVEVREAALSTLDELEPVETEKLVQDLLVSEDLELRTAAVRIMSRSKPEEALKFIRESISGDSVVARQDAYRTLGEMTDNASLELLKSSLTQLGSQPADTRLDIYLAAQKRSEQIGSELIEEIDNRLLGFANGKYEMVLRGGNALRGKQVFAKTELSCVRCHAIQGIGGNIGPDLDKFPVKKNRNSQYYLRSIIDPNADIAEGFGSVMILDIEGRTHIGIVKQETDDFVELIDDQGIISRIAQDDIEDRKETKSAMPEDLVQKMSLDELRDLLEYLSSLE